MKIFVDNIIFSIQKNGGVSVVWYEIITRFLLDLKSEVFFIDYKGSEKNIFRCKLKLNENVYYYNNWIVLFHRYCDLFLKVNQKFIFHSSYYRICRNSSALNVTTVHDFTYEKYSHSILKYIHIWQKHRAIKRSDRIICISQNSKNDLIKYVKDVDVAKIDVIYNGVSNDYFVLNDMESLDLPFEKNSYIVFVGSRVNYKRFDFCIDIIANTQYNLVIVGSTLSSNEIKILKNRIGCDRYLNLVNLSNCRLNVIYNGAFCLFYPSAYEGFGIPVIEAQKAGCPVIAYNGSSIPEIIGDNSLLFNNYNIEEIIEKIGMLVNKIDREIIISRGIENSKRFSWENTYSALIDVYEEVWNERKN